MITITITAISHVGEPDGALPGAVPAAPGALVVLEPDVVAGAIVAATPAFATIAKGEKEFVLPSKIE